MRENMYWVVVLLLVLPGAGCVAPRYSKPVYRPAPAPTAAVPTRGQQKRQQVDQRERSKPLAHSRQAPRHANQAVVRFGVKADGLIRQGKLQQAAQTLEQGLRIAPKDALLWSQLARVRLLQGRGAQAKSLATKSSSLARGNQVLVRQNKRIIAKAVATQ